MHAWYGIVKGNPKKFNFLTYFMVRYFRLLMITIPMLLLYFVLPHLGGFDYFEPFFNPFLATNPLGLHRLGTVLFGGYKPHLQLLQTNGMEVFHDEHQHWR